MLRRSLIMLAILSLLLLPAFSGVSNAEQMVYDVGTYSSTLEYHGSTSYNWVAYNSLNRTCLVTVNVSGANVEAGTLYGSSISSPFFVLDPGESKEVNLTVSGKEVFVSSDISINLLFTFRPMEGNKTPILVQKTVNVHLLPLGGESGPKNKVLGLFNNPLPYPYNQNVYTFLLSLGAWVLISLVIFFIIDPMVHHYTKKTKTQADDRFIAVVRKPVFVILFLYGAISSLENLNIDPKLIFMMSVIYNVVAILIGTWVVYRVYKDVILLYASEKAEKTETELDDTLLPLADKLGSILIGLSGLMVLLGYFGYDLTMLIAGMGILGLIIAFAAQDTLANFFSGIYLLIDRPFKTGDQLLMSDGDVYEVKHVGMRSTRLYNVFKHQDVSMPNNKLANNEIVNIMKPDRRTKVNVAVGVAYDADLKKAKEILLDIAHSHPHVIQEEGKSPSVSVVDLADSSVNLKIFLWVDDIDNRFGVMTDIRQQILARFSEAGIEIPFPQSVVWFHDMGGKS